MPTRLDYIVEDTQLYIDISHEISGATKLADNILYANIEPSGVNLNSNLAVSFAKIWTWAHDIFDFSPSGTDKIMIKASAIPSSIDTTYAFQEGTTVGAFQVKEGTSAWQTIAVHGVPTVDGNGKILQTFLPSYVDDVIEAYYDNGEFYSDPTTHTSATQIAHESGKIYVDITTNTSYRWGGSSYILITNPIDVFTGATAQANGVAGLVPAPLIADKDKFLKGDGTWTELRIVNYDTGTALKKTYSPDAHNVNTDIPETYLQVEYLESTGTQYINLGSLATDNYAQVTIDFSITHIVDNTWIAGNGNSWYSYYRGLGMLNGALRKQDQYVTYDPDTLQENLRVVGSFTVDESYQAVYAFARSGSNGIVEGYSQCRIYNLSSIETTGSAPTPRPDGATRNMYPCIRKSDNVPGLYDTVNDVFYTNQGTGDFICGEPLVEGGTTIFNVNVNDGLTVDANNKLNVKLGTGLSFDMTHGVQVNAMVGASSGSVGAAGTVPTPYAGDENKFLKGDGTWDTPSVTLPIASGATLGGIKVGNGLQIDANGVLSIDTSTTPIGTIGSTRRLLSLAGTSEIGNITELEVDT